MESEMKTLIAALAVITLSVSPTFAGKSYVKHLKEWRASPSIEQSYDEGGWLPKGGDVWFPKAARTCTYPYPWCMQEP
jgi:hypothetical protein